MYDCGRFKIGDGEGKRFEVRYRPTENAPFEPFGWSDKEETAQSMTYAISEHPDWKDGHIIDKEKKRSTCVDCGEWHDHPTSEHCDGCRFAGY